MARQYSSPRRTEQARETRIAIIDAALRLFLEFGYSETSMRDIARAAGVAERTIYVAFKDKVSLLTAIANHAYYGGSEDNEGQEDFYNKVASASDTMERVKMLVQESAAGLAQGLAALSRMVNAAARGDPRLHQFVLDMIERRHREVREEIELALGHSLPDDDRYERMVDEVEALTSEDLYWILVEERGWSLETYEAYLVDMCIHTIRRYGFDLP